MISRKIAGCCRRVLVVVLVSVLLVSACSPASSPSSQQALEVLEEVLTEEELEDLQEVVIEEELVDLAGQFSGEELVELLGSENVSPDTFEFFMAADGTRGWWEGFSEDGLRARNFFYRTLSGDDPLGLDANDASTPTGAFCWVVLRLREIMPPDEMTGLLMFSVSHLLDLWNLSNLELLFLEKEAANRGIELRETGSTGYNGSLRRFLLQVMDPRIRGIVLAEGLPRVLRPAAEAFYDFFEELLELPVYRVRPKIAELPDYPVLADRKMTGEDIRRAWPEIVELELGEDHYAEYVRLHELLEEEEVAGLLNSECKQRTDQEVRELACPPWVAEVLSCMGTEDEP